MDKRLTKAYIDDLLEDVKICRIEESLNGRVNIEGFKGLEDIGCRPCLDDISIDFSPFMSPYTSKKTSKSHPLYISYIRNILVNKPKRLVTVVFEDGSHEIITCQKDDHFDVRIGVALAISQHLFGSKNKFHKEVDKKTKFVENKNKDTKGKK